MAKLYEQLGGKEAINTAVDMFYLSVQRRLSLKSESFV